MTDTQNPPESKLVPMGDLRESLAMIARPAGVPVSFGGLSAALDELERLRALDAPALAADAEAKKWREQAKRFGRYYSLLDQMFPSVDAPLNAAGEGLSDDEILKRFGDAIDALKKFKAYVHQRLDAAGISTEPGGPHSEAGCRIGDRLDIVLDRNAEWHSLGAQVHALKAEVGKAKEAAFSEVESEMESLGFSAEEGWADVLRTLKAEVERLTCERDEAKERAVAFERLSQEFERDVRTTFEQSCKNLERAKAAEAEAKRLRVALMEIDRKQRDTIPADYRYDNNDIGKVKVDRDRLRTARYWIAERIKAALAPSQPAPANPNIDPDTGLDHTPEPIRRPAPASPVVGEGMKVCDNCKKPIAGDEHAMLEQDDSRIASVCWQSFHSGKCLEPSAPSPAGEGEGPAEAVDIDHRADFEERVKRHQVRCSHVEHGQRLCVGCAARAATEWINRLLLPVNQGGSGALVSRADLDAAVAKAVAETFERVATTVRNMADRAYLPNEPYVEIRTALGHVREWCLDRARSTSPAGGAP